MYALTIYTHDLNNFDGDEWWIEAVSEDLGMLKEIMRAKVEAHREFVEECQDFDDIEMEIGDGCAEIIYDGYITAMYAMVKDLTSITV